MPALIDLRRRIKSVRNTQQVTKAMKTVATAKYKKASRTVAAGRPQWHTAPASVGRVAGWAGPAAHPLLDVREERVIDVLVVTSDKGLCGAFNANLLAKTNEFLKGKEATARIRLALIGKKAAHFFKRRPYPVGPAFADRSDKLMAADLRDLARGLMEKFLFRDTDAIYLAYNEFKSVLAPKIMITRILPAVSAGTAEAAASEAAAGTTPDWEPLAPALVAALLPRYIEDQIVHAFAESQAAEQAARMMAMDSASNNAEDLIDALTLNLNKARQAGITKELLEIITAVDALKS
jgi:F-type H+-transporting ATPase subunit gamma